MNPKTGDHCPMCKKSTVTVTAQGDEETVNVFQQGSGKPAIAKRQKFKTQCVDRSCGYYDVFSVDRTIES